MKLSKKDQEVLARGYDSNFWRVFKKSFMEQRQLEIAQETPFSQDMEQVHVQKGRIMELNYIEKEMRNIYKKAAKAEEV